ncbi:MAG: hypothetical protein LBU33_00275 [Endomicrobium sp.]|jgi:hypothetical protein|nr:hypothetical protein [Endomicrobium sp.]
MKKIICIFLVSGCQPKEQIVHKDLSADLPVEPAGNSVISADNNLASDEPKLPESTALG